MEEGVLQNPRPKAQKSSCRELQIGWVVVVVYIRPFHMQCGSTTPFYSHGARNPSKAASSRGTPRTH